MIDPTARAWAYLSRVAEPPCAQLAALVRCVGPVEAADRCAAGRSVTSWRSTPVPDAK